MSVTMLEEQRRLAARRRRMVKRMTLQGGSIAEIAAELRVNKSTVVKYRRQLGIGAQEPSERRERREQVARMTELGLSATQIAQRLGIHKRLVVRDREAMGLTAGYTCNTFTPEEIRIAEMLLEDQCPLGEIAATLGRNRATVARKFRGRSTIKGNPLRGCHELRKQLGLL